MKMWVHLVIDRWSEWLLIDWLIHYGWFIIFTIELDISIFIFLGVWLGLLLTFSTHHLPWLTFIFDLDLLPMTCPTLPCSPSPIFTKDLGPISPLTLAFSLPQIWTKFQNWLCVSSCDLDLKFTNDLNLLPLTDLDLLFNNNDPTFTPTFTTFPSSMLTYFHHWPWPTFSGRLLWGPRALLSVRDGVRYERGQM